MFAGTFQRATSSRSSRARYTADRGAAKCLVILVVVMTGHPPGTVSPWASSATLVEQTGRRAGSHGGSEGGAEAVAEPGGGRPARGGPRRGAERGWRGDAA